MDDKFSLKGKSAIVTGAAGGIGGAIAKAFKDAGAQVACVDLAVDKIGRDYLPIRCDVSSEPETKAAVATIAKTLGSIHELVNAAALRHDEEGATSNGTQAPAGKVRHAGGDRSRCALPRLRCVELYDRVESVGRRGLQRRLGLPGSSLGG